MRSEINGREIGVLNIFKSLNIDIRIYKINLKI